MITIISYNTDERFLAFKIFKSNVIHVQPLISIASLIENYTFHQYVLFQINLTNYRNFFSDTKEPHHELEKLGYKVLNFGLYDISKSILHKMLEESRLPSLKYSSRDNPKSEIIIKSNYNYGGLNEKKLDNKIQKALKFSLSKNTPDHRDYKVMAHNDVPLHLKRDKSIIIERFISNKKGKYARVYKSLNNIIVSIGFVPEKQVKKMENEIKRHNYFIDLNKSFSKNDEIKCCIESIIQFNNYLHLDFFTADIVMDDSKKCYIIDLNDTPYWGDESQENFINFLSYDFNNNTSKE